MGKTAAAVFDTVSVDSGEDYDWRGANDGLDSTIGHPISDEHAALDATLMPSAPVDLNASSSYAAPCHTIDRSLSPSRVTKNP